MDCQVIEESLLANHFIKVFKNIKGFENAASVYVKEIKTNIFLLFIILEDKSIKALIAQVNNFKKMNAIDSAEILFFLLIEKNEDLHYFEKYLQIKD
ncbi:hypothetical protein [Elizabethkingia anophelis]|uniref:hypothetical protein n=1 Tax=Elizabethkingia anophelis TaxID=1117645 RepID=UPI00136C7DBB|nr:hypothetical protein [Elizabethkingia anophelis]MYY25910.1 hypothetical protein [Elizabethkingia anophelis]